MFISEFSVESWEENRLETLVKPVQTWAEIEAAIRALDRQDRTLTTLETESETHMAIGGGAGRYLVYLTLDNETFHYLIDSSKPDSDESLVVGGQEGVYPAKMCIGLHTALKAAHTFAETGEMERAVEWERDGVVERV